VILIGEENLPQELRRWERVHGRMLDWIAAQPGTPQDLALLIPIYARGVTIADDLKADILRAAGASIRRMCVNLSIVAERARSIGSERIAKADMGKAQFFTGEAPSPRRVA
jgi:pyrimidine operon attenuation protein/uracil phosphoribosyltransferase